MRHPLNGMPPQGERKMGKVLDFVAFREARLQEQELENTLNNFTDEELVGFLQGLQSAMDIMGDEGVVDVGNFTFTYSLDLDNESQDTP